MEIERKNIEMFGNATAYLETIRRPSRQIRIAYLDTYGLTIAMVSAS